MTAIWRQYRQIKTRFPDTLVAFRIGDFYEFFGRDAILVSEVLGITLTSRYMGRGIDRAELGLDDEHDHPAAEARSEDGDALTEPSSSATPSATQGRAEGDRGAEGRQDHHRVPLAGVPHHSIQSHLAKLIAAGHRVAVCEQVSEPGRGLVEREVVRVVTPGTVTEPTLLDDKENNYLAAAVVLGDRAGFAYADVSTGEFCASQISGGDPVRRLRQEIERLRVAELLLPSSDGRQRFADFPLPVELHITRRDAWHFELENAREALLEHLDVSSLDGFGCAGLPLAVQAAGAVVQYLRETQRSSLSQLSELRVYSTDCYMTLDAATRRNLELMQTERGGTTRGSVIWILDQTRTPMGGRLLRRWLGQPLLDVAPLVKRQEAVASLVAEPILRARLVERLSSVGDLERLINRIGQRMAVPRDLIALRNGLVAAVDLRELGVAQRPSAQGPIASVLSGIADFQGLIDLVRQAIVPEPTGAVGDGGVIAPGFSAELDQLVESTRHAREWIASLEAKERERTGIRSLKVGFNRVFGYYLEVSHANQHLVPEDYIRKQTLVGGERYITPDLKEYESLVLNAQEKIGELETEIFRQVCERLATDRSRVLATAEALAELDVYASLAEVAVRNNYVRPSLSDGPTIRIAGGRHPVVELLRREEPFVPNDVHLCSSGVDDDPQIVILTGPNMAGKSTYLRQVALIVLLAQIGSFVPADLAEIGLVDRVFTRIGAQDDIGAGQSTFLLEMLETANHLTQSTHRSLLIFDEVGRGTSTYDGMAIAQAVVEHIHNHPMHRAKTLFATHYHELTELGQVLPRVHNFRMDVREQGDGVVFLHRVVPGAADRSYGIHVARLAGVPRGVTRRAEEILKDLEAGRRGRVSESKESPQGDAWQLSLFLEPHPVLEDLKSLDVLSLTPLEALTKLFELQQKAQDRQ